MKSEESDEPEQDIVIDNSGMHTCDWCYRTFNSEQLLLEHAAEHLSVKSPRSRKLIEQSNRKLRSTPQEECTGDKPTTSGIFKDGQVSVKPESEQHSVEKVLNVKHNTRSSQSGPSSLPKSVRTEQCNICTKKFYNKEDLDLHIVSHSGKKFPCDFQDCPASYDTRNGLKYHLSKHNLNTVTCKFCNLLFTSTENRDKHELTHEIKKVDPNLLCRWCGAASTRRTDRIRHELKHCKVSPYREVKCKRCDIEISGILDVKETNAVLLDHLRDAHKLKGNHFCDLCHQLFPMKKEFIQHTSNNLCNKTVTRSQAGNL